MNSETKIPTLLALAILLTGIVVGVYSITQTQTLFSKASNTAVPKNITVSNLDNDSVSINFQTEEPVNSFIDVGATSSLGQVYLDERDNGSPSPHSLHFFTITGLTPNTTYYYKIDTGSIYYPDQPLSFKTTAKISSSGYQPLIGVITDANSQPIQEAFIQLQLTGAQTLTTVTKQNGSFILPLATLKNDNLDKAFKLDQSIPAKLVVFNNSLRSEVTINLPFNQGVLPKIILGQNLNFITPTPSPSPVLGLSIQTLTKKALDLNHDQKVDLNDLSLILKYFHSSNYPDNIDLNKDHQIDQSDIEIFQQFLSQQLTKENSQ